MQVTIDLASGPDQTDVGLFVSRKLYLDLVRRAAECARLQALIDTPELVDFPKAVHLEAVHQEQRWGTSDREGKEPHDWHWLLAHLAGRALEHHKEATRLQAIADALPEQGETWQAFIGLIAHHREKAAHHCITAAAALSHWHGSVIGKFTAMRPSSEVAAQLMAAGGYHSGGIAKPANHLVGE